MLCPLDSSPHLSWSVEFTSLADAPHRGVAGELSNLGSSAAGGRAGGFRVFFLVNSLIGRLNRRATLATLLSVQAFLPTRVLEPSKRRRCREPTEVALGNQGATNSSSPPIEHTKLSEWSAIPARRYDPAPTSLVGFATRCGGAGG